MQHRGFWWELAGKVGPPIMAGTIVAGIVQHRFDFTIAGLAALGIGLMLVAHWDEQHKSRDG